MTRLRTNQDGAGTPSVSGRFLSLIGACQVISWEVR